MKSFFFLLLISIVSVSCKNNQNGYYRFSNLQYYFFESYSTIEGSKDRCIATLFVPTSDSDLLMIQDKKEKNSTSSIMTKKELHFDYYFERMNCFLIKNPTDDDTELCIQETQKNMEYMIVTNKKSNHFRCLLKNKMTEDDCFRALCKYNSSEIFAKDNCIYNLFPSKNGIKSHLI